MVVLLSYWHRKAWTVISNMLFVIPDEALNLILFPMWEFVLTLTLADSQSPHSSPLWIPSLLLHFESPSAGGGECTSAGQVVSTGTSECWGRASLCSTQPLPLQALACNLLGIGYGCYSLRPYTLAVGGVESASNRATQNLSCCWLHSIV